MMSRHLLRRLCGAAVAGFLLTMSLMVATPAAAHTWSTYYTGAGGRWPGATTVRFYVRNGFPSSAPWMPTINRGADQWNAARISLEPRFVNAGATATVGNADRPCSATYNGVYWRDLDYLGSTVLGYTPHCENVAGVVTRFSMSIDADASWYVGTGATPNGRYDAWSVLTHEFGHATGWVGHFAESDSACPNDATRSTMCPSIYPGTDRQRTLGTHDRHTLQAAY
jgi:hypothetical protein